MPNASWFGTTVAFNQLMATLSIFEQLVATEAAVRLEFVYRCQVVMIAGTQGPVETSIADPDKGRRPEEVADNLCTAFVRIYDYAFEDSSQHHKVVGGRVCNTRDLTDENRAKMRDIFLKFAKRNYDHQGQLGVTPEQGPEALKTLFERLRHEVPLHNSSLACGALFVEMGLGSKWRKLFPRGIDFTRGEPVQESDPVKFLDARFDDAFFGADHNPSSSEFINPPESKVEIGGLRFAAKTVNQWRTHLVTQTGHLVDLNEDLQRKIEKHIYSGKPMDELRVELQGATKLSDFVEGFAQSREEQNLRETIKAQISRMSQSDSIDGLLTKDEAGQVRLMCMDVDFMTGLCLKAVAGQEKSELVRLKALMVEALGTDSFADLVPVHFTAESRGRPNEKTRELKREELKTHVRQEMGKLRRAARAKNDTALENIVAIAGLHLEAMLPRVDEVTDRQFIKDKLPVSGKHLYMTMGGSASGKSGLKRIADAECNRGKALGGPLHDARR